MTRVRVTLAAVLTVTATLLLASAAGSTTSSSAARPLATKAVFFAADGLRQDIVARYAAQGGCRRCREFLRTARSAPGNGLLTQAAPNTGAGWYTLATGAWPGVHGSTNNTFHLNGQPFANRTAAFDPSVLQAESIAQSAERGGLKVAQVEWAGGRNATTQGPTIDFRPFFSGRGVATNFIGTPATSLFDDVPFITAFGLQFDHPAGLRRPGAVPRRRADCCDRLDRRAAGVVQPGEGDAPARARLRRRQVRPERVHLRLHEQRPRRTTTVSSSRARRAPPTPSGSSARASGPTSR